MTRGPPAAAAASPPAAPSGLSSDDHLLSRHPPTKFRVLYDTCVRSTAVKRDAARLRLKRYSKTVFFCSFFKRSMFSKMAFQDVYLASAARSKKAKWKTEHSRHG